jgi:hypothetical protein
MKKLIQSIDFHEMLSHTAGLSLIAFMGFCSYKFAAFIYKIAAGAYHLLDKLIDKF